MACCCITQGQVVAYDAATELYDIHYEDDDRCLFQLPCILSELKPHALSAAR